MSDYILGESEEETRRLLNQTQKDHARQRLLEAGLAPGMTVVDAGCGPGTLSQMISEIIGPEGKLLSFDLSPSRIQTARESYQGEAEATFMEGRLESPPVPKGSADFVVCQFVLEFCRNPSTVVENLAALLTQGGILLLVDADGIGINNWPMPEVVSEGIPLLQKVLERTGFDAFVGRKLFSLANQAGLKEISVSARPWIIAGTAPAHEVEEWKHRFKALEVLGLDAFGGREAYESFTGAYLEMLRDPLALKFMDVFAVRGIRK